MKNKWVFETFETDWVSVSYMRYKDEHVKLLIFERWQLKSGEVVKTRNKISNHHTEQWTSEKTKAMLTFVRSWSIGLFAWNKEN